MTARLRQVVASRQGPLATGVAVAAALYLGAAVLVEGFTVPAPVLLLGVIVGLTYGLLAVGLVLVHRTSGIINFAHGEVGTFAASFFGVWVGTRAIGGFGLPYWLMLPAAMAVAAGANVAVEMVAVRRLRRAPKVMSLVMTLGAAQFLLLVSLAINTRIRSGSLYPRPPGFPTFGVGALTITPEYSAMLILSPILVGALALFLSRTRYGIALRAASENRDAALMNAIPADRMSSLAWALAGVAAAFVAILQFPQKGYVIGGTALGPALLVRGLLAAVVARLSSLPVALAFGVVVGVIEQVALWNTDGAGPTEVILFLVMLTVLLLRPRHVGRSARSENWAELRSWPQLPAAWRDLPRVRFATPVGAVVATLLFVGVGLTSNRVALAFTLVVAFTMVGLSVYVVTGLGGQLSLGQFAVAGVGAVVSVHVVDDVMRSIPVGILAGGLAGAAVCLLVGMPALRISGLMLGVATLAFSVAAEAWLFVQPWAIGDGVRPPRLVLVDDLVDTSRGYFLFALPFLAGALWLVRNVSRSSYGRALRGLRDNEDGARAFGVPATRRKLEAFAFAGFLAGCGGAIYAHGLPRLTASSFAATESITVVAVALIGGLALMIGPLLGALYLLALPALVTLDAVGLAVSTFGWLVLLLYFPGGLAQAVKPLRGRLLGWLAEGATHDEAGQAQDVVAEIKAATSSLVPVRATDGRVAPASSEALLDVTGLSKSFGGVEAVKNVSLQVAAGETVGIIGPNGAGKTTLFELIGGFTPADSGTVRFGGRDISDLSPERRSRLGVVRSFQDARLFPTLTVRETLELAAERQQPSPLWSSLVAWPSALARDTARRAHAEDLLGLMGLARYADSAVSELSTGTRRITDLAALLVLRPRLVLLDEPSSGVAQRETEALGGLLAQLRVALDTTFLIIEHDMPLLLGISDRVIAMETGQVIAEGRPDDVVKHPQVVASYLGQDRTAVERSGVVDAGRAPVRKPRPSTAGSTA